MSTPSHENTANFSHQPDPNNFAYPEKLTFRWRAYEHCDPPIDFHNEYIEAMMLHGNEVVADIGCGNGSAMFDLYSRHRHAGLIIGVDPEIEQVEESFRAVLDPEEYEEFLANVELIKDKAQTVRLPQKADAILVAHSMYLIPPKEQKLAIENLKANLNDGGRVVLATSSVMHKPVHRESEQEGSKYLKVKPPERMNAPFTSERAKRFLPMHFRYVQRVAQHTNMVIYPEDAHVWIGSQESMANLYGPPLRGYQWIDLVNNVLRPKLEWHFKQHGALIDPVRRDFFICSDTKFEPYVPSRF